MTDVTRDLPWWPPPDGEPLGQARAEELVAMLILLADPVAEDAEADLRRRVGHHAAVIRSRASFSYLAHMALAPEMEALRVGLVYAERDGDVQQNSLQLRRDGRLTWRRD